MSTERLVVMITEGFRPNQFVVVVPQSEYEWDFITDKVNVIISAIFDTFQTVQYLDNGKYFSRHFYVLKHRETRIVFLVVPMLFPEAVIDFAELAENSDFGVDRFALQSHRDMVMYLLSTSKHSTVVKNEPARDIIIGLCALVTNTLIV